MADQDPMSGDDGSGNEDCLFDDPFLEDGFGNLTEWRLSDLKKDFLKHLEDESSRARTRERKHPKEQKMKLHNDLMEQYMQSALKKYNTEESIDGDSGFEFVKAIKESFIVEGAVNFYRHFNFTAMQGSTIHLFFAEVIPDGESCDVSCCRLLQDNDNGRCLGCKNQGDPDLRHPASDNVYAGGHEDSAFPFLIDSDSEDDGD
ncbi:uncharacterized protein LOC120692136 [Panicum virgatum]|uniref:DUF3615 domain-containing protein n=1 Tax=Panicum virgatum TaxID=38727 RepID=A0A8T0MQX4_PANVG|nr:uncharacterized protein LOC120692136 [Panicum virgatum]KAG2539660.1 hypothetical protein PVAP13_9NG485000 [Panicum virgatum]